LISRADGGPPFGHAALATTGIRTQRFPCQSLQPYKLVGYLDYLQRRSFLSDVGVILQTLLAVLVPAAAPPLSLVEVRAIAAIAPAASLPGGLTRSS
jgi:hypothetical protein